MEKRQEPSPVFAGVVASVAILTLVGLVTYWWLPPGPRKAIPDDITGQTNAPAASQFADPTIASITPAGTDLILGIGAADHLVAISDLDEDRNGLAELPRVGDFSHTDWEKLALVSPKILLTQFGDRMPAGLRDRCQQMNIAILDVKLDVVEDVYDQALRIGDALGETAQARAAVSDMQHRLQAVAARWANDQRPRVAIVVSDGGTIGLIGPGTFHDELLAVAGGINVAASFHKPFVNVDREQLSALAPDVVLDLEPSPPTTPQQMRQSKRFWDSLPDLPAVRDKHVFVIDAPFCMRPGWNLPELAEIFGENLHGKGK